MSNMERIIADKVDDLHPVSCLAIWAAKHARKWEIKNENVDGDAVCVITMDEQEVARAVEKFRGKISVSEVRGCGKHDQGITCHRAGGISRS